MAALRKKVHTREACYRITRTTGLEAQQQAMTPDSTGELLHPDHELCTALTTPNTMVIPDSQGGGAAKIQTKLEHHAPFSASLIRNSLNHTWRTAILITQKMEAMYAGHVA
jgi:hypothetical protein